MLSFDLKLYERKKTFLRTTEVCCDSSFYSSFQTLKKDSVFEDLCHCAGRKA